ncbi:helix-turn-helix domain-containing protein [Galbibacter pacificus]|uniref:Helix-turn-helix transcriptional regulator n=1 Tax=Galbibacter pacificus TaxID=2996052 RepID=A0ABT6FN53_9FLAO|nr:response regulator transcription factor [Galbibacter pacificus]MDG3581219.1 helix-turn-helix transcriptional regulator [Galbibacter pacificus]MDG3584697.1 helix-turn-helix transcriptional regulator [Galbibacter pacificus]
MPGMRPHRIKTIAEFHKFKGLPAPRHPLISAIDYGAMQCHSEEGVSNVVFDFYNIAVKRGIGAKLKYGQQVYDFDQGIMFFIAPNQVFGIEPVLNSDEKRSGWMLLIHPDFLWNTYLAKNIKNYGFFDYAVNEALFLSDKEEAILNGIIQNIAKESNENIDQFSQRIIVPLIETLLNYSDRFYKRQFITREISSHQILDRLENVLTDYFNNGDLILKGVPTVQYIADALNTSPGYLSTLLKGLTGQNTQQHIHNRLIEKAKEKLSTTAMSVSEIAYELGFEYSQSFSKLFKNKTDMTPLEFRGSFN